ncbi:hypothetical protein, partial [Enterococcus faecium]|uniref:hypothetical protein n=1 Tax=Enterococcus faecium TaxID=1352 RepID=UPI003F75D9AD
QSINQCKITKNLSQNVVHSDSDLILHNSSVLIDKEPTFFVFAPTKMFQLFSFFIPVFLIFRMTG